MVRNIHLKRRFPINSSFDESCETSNINELPLSDKFHPKDLQRFNTDDRWIADFLVNNENNIKNSFKQFCETIEWRKSFGVNGKEIEL